MKKLTILSLFVALMATNADAQGFLKRLKDRAVDAVQRSVESKVENKAARVTNDAMDAVLDGKGKSDSSNDSDSSDDNRRSSRNEETAASSSLCHLMMSAMSITPHGKDWMKVTSMRNTLTLIRCVVVLNLRIVSF